MGCCLDVLRKPARKSNIKYGKRRPDSGKDGKDEEFDRATLLLDSSCKSHATKLTKDTNTINGSIKIKSDYQNPYYSINNSEGGGSLGTAINRVREEEEEAICDFDRPLDGK